MAVRKETEEVVIYKPTPIKSKKVKKVEKEEPYQPKCNDYKEFIRSYRAEKKLNELKRLGLF